MAADCLFFRSSMAFTVCAPFCTQNGSGLLILLLVNGFRDGLHADFLSGWQCLAWSSTCQWLSRFARCIAQRMAADCSYLCPSMAFTVCALFARRMTIYCSFFRSSTAFTVCTQYCSTDGSGLPVLPLVNGFHGLRAVLLRGCLRIAHTSTRQRLPPRFVCRIALRMSADCS